MKKRKLPRVSAEPGMVKISFWLTDRDGSDYVMRSREDQKLTERREDLLGTLEEFGGNYVTVCYDSIESAQMFVAEDAKMLNNILNEKEREDERW